MSDLVFSFYLLRNKLVLIFVIHFVPVIKIVLMLECHVLSVILLATFKRINHFNIYKDTVESY